MRKSMTEEWTSVKVPPPPEVKEVRVDADSTELLLLEFTYPTCNAAVRCPRRVDSIRKVQKLLERAKADKMAVVYSLSPGGVPADIHRRDCTG